MNFMSRIGIYLSILSVMLISVCCRLAGPGEPIYSALLSPLNVLQRISLCHEPYHKTLASEMTSMHREHGKVCCCFCTFSMLSSCLRDSQTRRITAGPSFSVLHHSWINLAAGFSSGCSFHEITGQQRHAGWPGDGSARHVCREPRRDLVLRRFD